MQTSEQDSKIQCIESFERNRSKEELQEVLNIYHMMVHNFFMFLFPNIATVSNHMYMYMLKRSFMMIFSTVF